MESTSLGPQGSRRHPSREPSPPPPPKHRLQSLPSRNLDSTPRSRKSTPTFAPALDPDLNLERSVPRPLRSSRTRRSVSSLSTLQPLSPPISASRHTRTSSSITGPGPAPPTNAPPRSTWRVTSTSTSTSTATSTSILYSRPPLSAMPRTRRSASWYDCVFVPNRVPEPDRRVANLAHLDAKLAEERTATVPGDRKQIPEPKALALAPALSKEKPLPTEKPLPPLPVGPAKEEEEEEEEGDEEGKEGKWEGEDGDDDGDGDGDGDWNGSLAASSESDEVVVFGIATAVSVTRVRAKLVDILPRKAARGC